MARAPLAALLIVLAPRPAAADHGPGTAGGALALPGAATLPPGRGSVGLRTDATVFEELEALEMRRMVGAIDAEHAHVDALDWTIIESLEAAYGATELLEVAASFGWYRGEGLREQHRHAEVSESHAWGDVTGMTDLWLLARLALLRRPTDRLALATGFKLPTGRTDARGDGESAPLEPALQPGSGAFDASLGVGLEHDLGPRLALHAGASLLLRTEADDARLGHRIEGGGGAAYRIGPVTAGLEAIARWLLPNQEHGETVDNSGGVVLWLAPLVRAAIGPHLSVVASPQLPLVQSLRGPQQRTVLKLVVGIEIRT